jgi:transcriptional regulator with XRE-family HTH domain
LPAPSGSPIARRRELGVQLKALRTEKGWTVEQVAERLEFSASKVSRLETGQRGASARDIRDLCDLYAVDDDRRQHLVGLAAEGKQTAWYQRQTLRGSRYVGLEAAAKTVSDFGLGLVPGPLQTSDYARAIMRGTLPAISADVIEQRLEARMARQQALASRTDLLFEALLDESVLHRLVGGREVMKSQLGRLLELSELDHVAIRVLPFERGALPSNNNKFIILTFERPDEEPPIVFVETLTADHYLDRPDDVAEYQEAFKIMQGMAATPAQTRDLIAEEMARLTD